MYDAIWVHLMSLCDKHLLVCFCNQWHVEQYVLLTTVFMVCTCYFRLIVRKVHRLLKLLSIPFPGTNLQCYIGVLCWSTIIDKWRKCELNNCNMWFLFSVTQAVRRPSHSRHSHFSGQTHLTKALVDLVSITVLC